MKKIRAGNQNKHTKKTIKIYLNRKRTTYNKRVASEIAPVIGYRCRD